MKRRHLLKLGGAALTLPFLRGATARAQDSGDTGDTGGPVSLPKRFILYYVPQGTVMAEWLPTGSEYDFTLPYITEPLAPFQDRMIVVSGVDNLCPQLNSVGNAHQNANLTVLAGRPFHIQDSSALSAAGPTIDQVLAERLSLTNPFQRLDFSVGGSATANGVITTVDGLMWHGVNDPVASFNSPETALLRIFGDNTISPEDAWAQRAHRAAVLDKVMRGFTELEPRLSPDDRVRLQSHADKVEQLYGRMVAGTGTCERPSFSPSGTYDYSLDDHISAPVMNDLLVTAMACDYTRVGTLNFANSHDHDFPWLTAVNGGLPIVDRSLYDAWHTMVHDDWVPGAEHVYRWYMEQFADLLGRLATTVDADGDNMLDTSLVLCISEYSSGRHWNTGLPVILAGNVGGAQLGRWVDHMVLSAADFQENGAYAYSGQHIAQLYVSLLNAFGFDDTAFGYDGEFNFPDWVGLDTGGLMPQGPLAGLL